MRSLVLQPLQIKSVVAPEHVKGYIYVEAYKQTHVKQAIEGVGNLRMGYWNQQMVPIKEMTDVLKVVKEVTNLKPKSWVRLKRGIYKDDIAQVRSRRRWGHHGGGHTPGSPRICAPQVDYVEPSQNQISLKMIPRIDFDRIKARMSLVSRPVLCGCWDCCCHRVAVLHSPPTAPCPTERLVRQEEKVQATPAAAL